jgi:hypothetical protein
LEKAALENLIEYSLPAVCVRCAARIRARALARARDPHLAATLGRDTCTWRT